MIIDLCCGIGRWDEDTVSIDINPKVRPTIVADVRYLPLRKGIKPKLVHASPPCTYFSNVRTCRGEGYNLQGISESLKIVAACFEAFDYLQPEMWTLENPYGMLNRIIPTLIETEYSVEDMPKKRTMFWSNNRALRRALIPQDVRQRILETTK